MTNTNNIVSSSIVNLPIGAQVRNFGALCEVVGHKYAETDSAEYIGPVLKRVGDKSQSHFLGAASIMFTFPQDVKELGVTERQAKARIKELAKQGVVESSFTVDCRMVFDIDSKIYQREFDNGNFIIVYAQDSMLYWVNNDGITTFCQNTMEGRELLAMVLITRIEK